MRTFREKYEAPQQNEEMLKRTLNSKVINGVTFYYDDDFEMTDDAINYLAAYSQSSEIEDEAYTVYWDDGILVVY